MQFLTLFSFFANNSRMKQPTPVFLSYMDFPYAIEGGSTIIFFWVLNKLYMAKREAILMKLISEPLTLRPLCCSRLRSNEKCLVDQLLLGQNLLKNVFNSKTFLN